MQKRNTAKHKPWRGENSTREAIVREIGVVPFAWKRSLRKFAVWLKEDRGLALSSIACRIASIRRFVVELNGKGGVQTLKSLKAIDVEDFFIGYSKDHGYAVTRSMQASMRLFLGFAATKRWVRPGLANAVPSIRRYRLSDVPTGLTDEIVQAMVAASAQKSARDHAIVLLLAVYGTQGYWKSPQNGRR